MYAGFILIVAISLVLQVAAAFLAMRLIRVTGPSRAWIVIAMAILAMAVRRLAVLVGVVAYPVIFDRMDYWSEVIGLLNAVLLLVGIALIAPLFRTIQRAKETVQQARVQLEQEVRQRTADLVAAHEKLQAEFAHRAQAEAALRDEHNRLHQVLEMSESDQRLLAYEIHDGFVQPATAALMNLQAGVAAFGSDPDRALENVVHGLQYLQESISQVRWLIGGLRPVVLEEQGLVAAIDGLVQDTGSRTAAHIDWSHQVQFERLAPALEMAVFRIVQEALRNALRHSRSERIEITLTQTGGTLFARIQDWGCGFDPSLPRPDHFGLEGMRERARLFGGGMRIESQPGAGTCVTAEFPV